MRPLPGRRNLAAPLILAAVVAAVLAACSPAPRPSPVPIDAARIAPGCPPADGPDDFGQAAAGAGVVRLACLTTLEGALALAVVPGVAERWLVASQDGQVWLVTSGERAPAPVLDLGGLVSGGPERGLLGIALHPRFPADPRFFVDYTDPDGATVVASYRIDPGRLDRRQRQDATVLLRVSQPAPIHNGGGLLFGPDGFLYVSLGDGGGDPMDYTDTLDSLLGSILRIDVDRREAGREYGIPAGNPFAATPGARPEIWLRGFRNPWRFTIDRVTGDLWVADVGANTWEEVDVARAGEAGLHFGWPVTEGRHCYLLAEACSRDGLTQPVLEYPHGERCAVTGGVVYRGTALPALVGRYVFADFCTGELFAAHAMPADGPAAAADGSALDYDVLGRARSGVAAIVEDASGELLVLNVSDGTVSRVLPG